MLLPMNLAVHAPYAKSRPRKKERKKNSQPEQEKRPRSICCTRPLQTKKKVVLITAPQKAGEEQSLLVLVLEVRQDVAAELPWIHSIRRPLTRVMSSLPRLKPALDSSQTRILHRPTTLRLVRSQQFGVNVLVTDGSHFLRMMELATSPLLWPCICW